MGKIMKFIGEALSKLLKAGQLKDPVPEAKRPHLKRKIKYIPKWYRPHKRIQGEREKSRRLRQIDQGVISRDQLYVYPE